MNLLICMVKQEEFKYRINNTINDTLSELEIDNLTSAAKEKKMLLFTLQVYDTKADWLFVTMTPCLASGANNCIYCSCDWPLKAN